MSRLLSFEKLNNTRDLGPLGVQDGRQIKPGLLLRSGHLYFASPRDLDTLRRTVSLVVDFRSGKEQQEKPDPDFGAEYVHLPALDQLAPGVTRDESSDAMTFDRAARDPQGARAYMVGTYREFVISPFARQQYARFLRLLLLPREKAVLWHCTAGKDRAGFAAILLLEILGAEREQIRADYLDTNRYLAEECRFLTGFLGEKFGGLTPEIAAALDWLFGAKDAYFDAIYDACAEAYGGMEGYLRSGLGLTGQELSALRERFLEPADGAFRLHT